MITPVITPKMRSTCKDCKYFDLLPNHPNLGTCHRYPPSLYGGTMHAKLPDGSIKETLQNNTAWPMLGPDQWCGEFQLNLIRAEMN